MGFDVKCIPNIESIPREHFCPVCQLLINPNEALQSMCGHLFCKPCLAYVASTTRVCPYDGYLVTETDAKPLAESNKTLAETIGKTVVNCLYQNSGCTWQGSLSESSSHCSECAFSSSLVRCYWCGTQVAHRQGQEHLHVCPVMQQVQMQAYIQASRDVAISQASAQGYGVAAATLTQDQWYQQQYQQFYQNYTRYFMHQLHLPGLAPQNAGQHQLPYIQPAAQYAAQSHPQMQAQPQLQSQSLVLHQPHVVFSSAPHLGAASLPQAYPSVPPHPQHPSPTFPASQGLHDLQAQAQSQTKPLSQAHHLTNSQVPQHHHFHGQIQNDMHPHATVQNSPPDAYGQKLSPQPNQRNQVEVPPNNMPVSHQVGTQTPQVQNHFSQQGLQKHPQTLEVHHPVTTILGFQPQMNHHSASASQVGSGQAAPSLPDVKEADIQRTQNQVSKASWGEDEVPLNYIVWKQGIEEILDGSEARSTSDSTNAGVNPALEVTTVKFNHEHKGQRIDACVENLKRSSIIVEGNERKSGLLGKQVMEENVGNGRKNLGKSLLVEKKGTESGASLNGTPQLNPVLLKKDGLRYLNHHSASTSQVGSGQAAPSLPAVKEADIQRTQNQVPQASWGQDEVPLNYVVWKQGIEEILDDSEARSTSDSTNAGVNPAVEVTTVKFDHEHKGKRIDACVGSLHRSSIIVEGNERKSGPLGKQVMEENVGNGRKSLGKSLLVENKGTESGPSLNGTPQLNPVLLKKDGLRYLNILHQQYLRTAHLHSEDVERSGDHSSGSLDRGFDQRSLVRPNKKHELDFELRPGSRFSQPSIDLGEQEFRRGQRSLISEHLGMPSHGYGTLDHGVGGSRAKTTDIEGRFGFGLLRSELKGHGNLQRDKVQDADVSGPVDNNNGLWPRDVGFKSRYTWQGVSGDGGSFPGDLGSSPNSRKMATGTFEGLNLHSQTREHQQQSMDMDVLILQNAKKLNLASADSSPFGNPNKNEESRFRALGYKEEKH